MTPKLPAGLTTGHLAQETWFGEGCYITEWMNNDNNPDLSVARARVPAGTTTRWHQLEGIAERYVILSGSGDVQVGHRLSASVEPGDCVTIPPATPQRITAAGTHDLVFLAICTPRFEAAAYSETGPPQDESAKP